MKNPCAKLLCSICLFLALSSCNKSSIEIIDKGSSNEEFDHYIIPAGHHYSTESSFSRTAYSELRFLVRFDQSAIYQTIDTANQYDINKLYGFSDNEANHHTFSARIGWRWSENALRLFGYVYNNGEPSYEEITSISIGTVHECSIRVTGSTYVFTVNSSSLVMPRSSTGAVANGYKLFPYFGGDEMAPHDIHIWIKEK